MEDPGCHRTQLIYSKIGRRVNVLGEGFVSALPTVVTIHLLGVETLSAWCASAKPPTSLCYLAGYFNFSFRGFLFRQQILLLPSATVGNESLTGLIS